MEQVTKEKNINEDAFGVKKKGLFKNGQKMGYDRCPYLSFSVMGI